jgi:alpha-tubulin suppressor-like RCC1 family protein
MHRRIRRSCPLLLAMAALSCSPSGDGSTGVQVATQLALVTSAAGASSGLAFTTQPVVAIRDAAGNTVVGDNGSVVTVTVSDGASPGAVVGTATAQALAGVARFSSVGISGTAGSNYTLTYTRDGLPAVTQTIVPGAGTATTLAIATSAAGAPSGSAFTTQPVVRVVDANGNTVTTSTSTVTMTVSAGATPVGTATVNAVAGVAAFATAGVSGAAGTTYTLTFSAVGLALATQGITPVPGAVSAVTVTPATTTLLRQQTRQLGAVARDAYGNVVPGQTFGWSSTVGSVVEVSGAGVATAIADGEAIITATTAGRSGQSTVTAISFTRVVGGEYHSCALTGSGAAYCWGDNEYGQLGDGTGNDRLNPVPVQGGHIFSEIVAGSFHTCALTTLGAAYCWGGNADFGTVGDGTALNRNVPTAVLGGQVFNSLGVGVRQSCGVTTSGAAYCWGHNVEGELGDGTQTLRRSPVAVQGGISFTRIVGGNRHTCGLAVGGTAYCWGRNTVGQLGDGSVTMRLSPVAVQVGSPMTSLAAGSYHNCGLFSNGTGQCWGTPGWGQLTPPPLPAATVGFNFVSVTIRNSFAANSTCWQTGSGALYCGGPGGTPALADFGIVFTRVNAAPEHHCGVSTAGVAYCWGRNVAGPLGDGTQTTRAAPVAVVMP